MTKIIKPSEYVEKFRYTLDFQYVDEGPHCGYGFECDSEGNILWDEMTPAGEENLNRCLTGETHKPVFFAGISEMDLSYWSDKVIECEGCHNEVVLYDSWASECDQCGLEYNGSGQRLAPRSQWGEEWTTKPEEDYGLY